jgi:hypothetical protein
VNDLLTAFAAKFESADAIADECRRRGIRGQKGYCEHCAVARLLQDELRVLVYVGSPAAGTVVCVDGSFSNETRLGKPFFDFVQSFDGGRYPDLVATAD